MAITARTSNGKGLDAEGAEKRRKGRDGFCRETGVTWRTNSSREKKVDDGVLFMEIQQVLIYDGLLQSNVITISYRHSEVS